MYGDVNAGVHVALNVYAYSLATGPIASRI